MMQNKYQILVMNGNPKSFMPFLKHTDYMVSFFSELQELIYQIQNRNYDLVIIDSDSLHNDGLNLLTDIKNIMPTLPVVVISSNCNVSDAVEYIKAGACDFVEKPFKIKKLLLSVENSLRGFQVTKTCNENILKKLTQSELRIIKLILEGKSNKEAAHILNRSERTIEDHRSNIMKKLQVDNIVELVKKGIALGLTSL